MTNLFILYLAAAIVPVWYPSWKLALAGLGCQGVCLALILLAGHDFDAVVAAEFVLLLAIRGAFLPWRLSRAMPGRGVHLTGARLRSRAAALAALAVGMGIGWATGEDIREALQLGTAATGLLAGMLMIANEREPYAQLAGLCVFEGGVTLVELLSPHAMPFPMLLAVAGVDMLFVATCGAYLDRMPEACAAEGSP